MLGHFNLLRRDTCYECLPVMNMISAEYELSFDMLDLGITEEWYRCLRQSIKEAYELSLSCYINC